MKNILEKFKGFFFINTFIEFSSSFKSKPRYRALEDLSSKVFIRLDYEDFLNLQKKNSSLKIPIIDYLNYSLQNITSSTKKTIYITEFLKKDKELLKSFSDEEKLKFFYFLLDQNLGSTEFFFKIFCEFALKELEDVNSIGFIDKFLSNLLKKQIKFYHLPLSEKIVQFLLEIMENNMDLLDDKKLLILLQINLKLRFSNLILINGSLEHKFLNKIEDRFTELLQLENLNENPDFLSQVMFFLAKLNYSIKNQNLVDFFEKNLFLQFKSLNAIEIYRTLLFLLSYNAKNGMKQKQFLDVFYIKYMHGTKFYLKEYLTRMLNIKKFELNFFKNLAMIFTRFFLSYFRVMEPRYLKDFHFDLFQLGDLLNSFGRVETFNLSNIMIVLKKHILQRLQFIYEYKLRKNVNMEYKIHGFWVQILEYFEFQLRANNEYILKETESALLFEMAINYSILNSKKFEFEELIVFYGIFEKAKIFEKKLSILKVFIDEKCAECIKDPLKQSFYIINNPMIMTKALEQGLRLQRKNMIELPIIVNIMKQMLDYLKNFDNDILLKFLQLIEMVNLKEGSFEFSKEIMLKMIQGNNVETFFIKDFEILLSSLRLLLEFFCDQVIKNHQIHFFEKMSQSINLLLRKLLFIDSKLINENSLGRILLILKTVEEKYLKLQHGMAKEFESLSKFCLRYIADKHKKFSYVGLEKVLRAAFQMNATLNKFDDGSGLYEKTLMQEMDTYLEDNWRWLSEGFRNEWNELKIKHSTNHGRYLKIRKIQS